MSQSARRTPHHDPASRRPPERNHHIRSRLDEFQRLVLLVHEDLIKPGGQFPEPILTSIGVRIWKVRANMPLDVG